MSKKKKSIYFVEGISIAFFGASYAKLTGSLSPEAIAERMAPEGQVAVEGAVAVETAVSEASGPEKIYKSNSEIIQIGVRHGEKKHESLLSSEEKLAAEEMKDYYRIKADNRDLNYERYFSKGNKVEDLEDFNSFNTIRLNEVELIKLLESIGYK